MDSDLIGGALPSRHYEHELSVVAGWERGLDMEPLILTLSRGEREKQTDLNRFRTLVTEPHSY